MKPLLLLLALFLAPGLHSQSTFYVKTTGNDYNTGTSWSTALKTIRKALSRAGAGQRIFVAAGTYYPDEGTGATNNDRENSFVLKSGVAIYGGFAGNEISIEQRNWNLNQTILSGDIDQGAGTVASYHVVTSTAVDSLARLDGFYIMQGKASTSYENWGTNDYGGGMYNYNSSATIANCTFSSNWAYKGGGIFNEYSPVRVVDCNFSGNVGYQSGGGIYNSHSNATITRCRFNSNATYWTDSGQGGGIANKYSSPLISHCIFQANQGYTSGGISNSYGAVKIQNCVFNGNTASAGPGALINSDGSTRITNCTFWGNSGYVFYNLNCDSIIFTNCIIYGSFRSTTADLSITYSLLSSGYPGTGNVTGDPRFKNAAAGDFRLDICSPAINGGTNAVVDAALDLGKRPRIIFGRVDMGAYEMQDLERVIYVNDAATGLNNGTSWSNAYTKLQDALARANCNAPIQIWVAAGTYYPDEGQGITNNDLNQCFQIRSGLELYGNFTGTEDSLHKRRLTDYYATTLSGDINKDGNAAGNAYHVLKGLNVDTTAILDGFTIRGGNAMHENDPSNWNGGGMFLEGARPKIYNCRFLENNARYFGGAISCRNASPEIVNSIFWKNQAVSGGAIYNYYYGHVQLYNCSFWGNTATTGGALRNVSASAKIVNCILWDDQSEISNSDCNPDVSYSIVQGGYYPGNQILNVDPMYTSPAYANLKLYVLSPAIDTGNNAEVKLPKDLESGERIWKNKVDLGAFEYHRTIGQGPHDSIVDPIMLVCPADYSLTGSSLYCGAVASYEGEHQARASWDDGTPVITYDPPAGSMLPAGENTVTVTALGYVLHPGRDPDTVSTTCSFKVQVTDLTPPVISTVTVSEPVLYPPNHKMREVLLNYTVMDNCALDTVFIQVISNEDKPGGGASDWQLVNAHHLKLRAERNGNGTGREYGIIITAIDVWGNAASSFATVTVPHDKGNVQTTMERDQPEISGLSVQVLPNPSSGAFRLSVLSGSVEWMTIKLMDNLGREIETRKNGPANLTVLFGANYPPGIYYVQVIQGGAVRTVRVVKQ